MANAVRRNNSKGAGTQAAKSSATAKPSKAGNASIPSKKGTKATQVADPARKSAKKALVKTAVKAPVAKTVVSKVTKAPSAKAMTVKESPVKAIEKKPTGKPVVKTAKKNLGGPVKKEAQQTPNQVNKPVMPQKPVHKILITQPRPDTDKSPYFELARKYKIDLEFFPFIRVEGVSGRDFRRQRVDISEYTAIIFTSRSAVDHFFRILDEMKVRVSQEMKYCCITEAVALYLQKFILYRKRKVFFSADGSTQGLLDVIGKHKNERYVVPTSESGKNEINQYLSKHSIPFAEVTLFHTVSNDIASIMKLFVYDMIVFFSPFSVQTLLEHSPKFKQNGTLIGAFGPSTTKAIEELGLRLDVKAPAPNAPSMITALEQFLDAIRK